MTDGPTDRPTDGQTNQQTDRPSYRDAFLTNASKKCYIVFDYIASKHACKLNYRGTRTAALYFYPPVIIAVRQLHYRGNSLTVIVTFKYTWVLALHYDQLIIYLSSKENCFTKSAKMHLSVIVVQTRQIEKK